jgi:hypothetical protein
VVGARANHPIAPLGCQGYRPAADAPEEATRNRYGRNYVHCSS